MDTITATGAIGPRKGDSQPSWWWRIFFFGLISLFFFLKLQFYWGFEYTSDFFTTLNASRSFLRGDTLFFDPYWGERSWHHNHFLLLLLGPITSKFGGIGLILAEYLLFLIASWVLLCLSGSSRGALILTSVFLGPVVFWLIDDPLYGFHPEIIYIPLTVFLMWALIRGRLYSTIFFSFLILLNREDGAVLLSSLLVLWFAIRLRPEVGVSHWRLFVGPITLVLISCFCLTLLSQFLLQTFGSSERNLAGQAITGLTAAVHNPHTRNEIGQMLVGTISLTIVVISTAIPVVTIRRLAALGLSLLPVLSVAFLASLSYFPAVQPHGMTWGPRFSLIFSVIVAWIALIVVQDAPSGASEQKSTIKPPLRSNAAIIGCFVLSLFLQHSVLQKVRNYDLKTRLSSIRESLRRTQYEPRELRLLDCLSKSTIDRFDTVGVPIYLEASTDTLTTVQSNWALSNNLKPAFVVCDLNRHRNSYTENCLHLIKRTQSSEHHFIRRGALVAIYDPLRVRHMNCLG